MYIVTVKFLIKPEFNKAFIVAMNKQASDSLKLEKNCKQFDVCISEEDKNCVFLYEKYTTKQDFDDHLKSDHFAHFSKTISPWIENKTVESFTL